jgi:DNA-binding NarL/FixJ family response regulator
VPTRVADGAARSYPAEVALRLVVAEDSYLVREGLRQALNDLPGIETVAICEDLPSLLAAIEEDHPDVVLTDIRMPPGLSDEGIQVSERLRDTSPSTGLVVLSQYLDAEYALALLDRGAAGRAYLLKERVSDREQLLAAIREVARGGSVIDPKVVEKLLDARNRRANSALAGLTPREREVLAAVAQGKNNAAIAAQLFLTERAVEKHINSIFSKLQLSEELDVHRRVKAVLMFLAEEGAPTGKQ